VNKIGYIGPRQQVGAIVLTERIIVIYILKNAKLLTKEENKKEKYRGGRLDERLDK
jgi:hypothetical protein